MDVPIELQDSELRAVNGAREAHQNAGRAIAH
jgi:hypothetical protein